ncbi:MAG: hypothetical protein QNK04_18880 [Myxococcota bacterium]|nr:hypothetical protein [Myxococcota bacterium]
MNGLSLSDKIELIRARAKLARDIRNQHRGAELSDLINAYNQAEQEFGRKPSVRDPSLTDTRLLGGQDDVFVEPTELGSPDVDFDVDRSINPENLISAANLYACYQYDQLGTFEVTQRIFEDFFHGKLRITTEPGAIALYRYEKRKKDRFPRPGRLQMYKRNFNYGPAAPPRDVPLNRDFHSMLTSFVNAVTSFYRDQRISQVIQKGARGLESSFGSLERVRRAGIDLRNSVHRYSSGITLLFTLELSHYLDECLSILRLEEVHRAYNVSSEWALIEKVGEQRLNKREKASVRGSLAQEGKNMLEWLAGDNVLEEDAIPFEITLNQVGQWAERWAISQRTLGRA